MNDTIATELKRLIYEAIQDAVGEHAPDSHQCTQPVIVDRPAVERFEDLPPIMSAPTLAEHLELDPKTLERWRKTWPSGECTGPRFSKAPGTKLYRYYRRDVLAWLNSGLA